MNADPLKVALRADASVQIGLGHVKRCLALGQALQEIGAKVCLVARELGVDTASLAGSVSIEYFALPPSRALTSTRTEGNEHQSWTNVGWMEDADATADALSDWVPDLVVVDNYAFDARWHHAVATALNVRIAAVDDLGDRDLDVDWLIDHNHSTDHRAKYAGRVKPGTKMLCGPRYALLAPVYATAKRHVLRPCVESIGVFMGGTDSTGLSNDVVRACREVAGFGGRIEVATTRANPHLAELQAACQRWPLTTLTIDAPDLAAFFAHHDLQIGAGGGATWERCCIGAPTLAVICTDNQRIVIPALVQLDVLATTEPADDSTVELIGRAVSALLQDSERRATLSQRARLMVDGLGARRVALHLAARTLVLRNASAADAELMYRWRNDSVTRAMSHDTEEIAWPAHVQWLDGALADPTRRLLVASIGSIPVGVIRFDRHVEGQATVSLYLDPSLHGLGLGTAMLMAGERHASILPDRPARFQATVIEANAGSQRLFRSAGYAQDGERWTKTAALALCGETPT